MTTYPRAPHVYQAIRAITSEFAGDPIPKSHINLHDQYFYRSIDDVLNRLGPLLAKHRLCVLPRVFRRTEVERPGDGNCLLVSVSVEASYDLVSARDGSRHRIRAMGEALDAGDKATAKAMSAAYKYAMLQAFCIPVARDDPEQSSHKLRKRGIPEPEEGWTSWSATIVDMIQACEKSESLTAIRVGQRRALAALGRARPELHAAIGDAFQCRLAALSAANAIPPVSQPKQATELADA
jgi:hypothetical protein